MNRRPLVLVGGALKLLPAADTMDKALVGLSLVDNVPDALKPVSAAQQTAISAKEPTITAGTAAQYWRGDKTWIDFGTTARATTLTGFTLTVNSAVVAADTFLGAVGKLQAQVNALNASKIDLSLLGALNGVAGLDSTGTVPSSQLPSYVDDVLEYANFAALPATGEAGKIYILATPYTTGGVTSSQFRWSGSAYAAIIASPGSTDSVTEGSVNLYFTESRVRAAVLTGISFASGATITATDTVLSALGKLQKSLSDTLTNFDASVRAVTLLGLAAGTNVAIVAGDTVLAALAKLQAQVTARLPLAGGKMTGAINNATPTTIASTATPAIGASAANTITITGTTTITGFDSIAAGAKRTLIFSNVLTLTNSAALTLLGGANIITAPGDVAEVEAISTTVWKCTDYVRADGTPLNNSTLTENLVPDPTYNQGASAFLSAVTIVPATDGTAPPVAPAPRLAKFTLGTAITYAKWNIDPTRKPAATTPTGAIQATPGDIFELSAQVYIEGASRAVGVYVEAYNAAGASIAQNFFNNLTTLAQWVTIGGTYTVPAGTVSIGVYIRANAGTAATGWFANLRAARQTLAVNGLLAADVTLAATDAAQAVLIADADIKTWLGV